MSKVEESKFTICKLDVNVPKHLECLWVLLRINSSKGRVNKIVICSFYCPPQSSKKRKTELIDHFQETWEKLKTKYLDSLVIFAGDANELQWKDILQKNKSLRQIVVELTRGNKIFDICNKNQWKYYQKPEILPPIKVDPDKRGEPSDLLSVKTCDKGLDILNCLYLKHPAAKSISL